ncbi:GNAT family N-acetyltransferase [Clostridium perfringens]|nr:GNAT family N-acetyltransferase [Clostridium perfringens]
MNIKDYNRNLKEKVLNMNWEDKFVKKDVLGCLEEWPQCGIIIEEDKKALAVGVFIGISKETSFTLYVDPVNRGKGVGKTILKSLEKKR